MTRPHNNQQDSREGGGKREASSYSGSYRPSDAQSSSHVSPAANTSHDYHTGIPDNPAADQEDDLPPYSETLGTVEEHTGDLDTQATVADDGRVNINIGQSKRLSSLLAPALRNQFDVTAGEDALPPPYIPPSLGGDAGEIPPPQMNVVIQVVGSRGDVQPFVALGKVLKDTYGHRVRLATHPTFEKFVEENGLEFFSIGGDPAELMAFMVKNPSLMPDFATLRRGDIGDRRRGTALMLKGCWRSCIESGNGLGVEATDNTVEDWMTTDSSSTMSNDPSTTPFVADVIIANPPSFAHVHCAEKLGIPLHLMFTMPWSPTQQFPHPLANIQSSNAETSMTNFISYALVDMLTWQGLGDVINKFRQQSLGLEPLSLEGAPGMLQRLKIPYTYCWSPALIPKPRDWRNWINIAGFFFLNLATNYTPEPALAAFLNAGQPPVYIGFGSIVVEDPNAMTKLIFDAVRSTGQRALVSKGWGGFGADQLDIPEGVFMLGNVPHDWLFKQVSCVVHHGGAGTTAAGIAAGRPTVIVPFFGDQPFWGAMIAKAKAGPDPIPIKTLTSENLAAAIMTCLEPASLDRAKELSKKIAAENGTQKGAQSFHQTLGLETLRCSLAPHRIAIWRIKRTQVRLSALAASVLVQEKQMTFNDLKLYRPRNIEADTGPWDPITGSTSALMGTISSMVGGVADFPVETLKALGIHPDVHKKKGKGKATEENADSTSQASGLNTTDLPGSKAPNESTDKLGDATSDAMATERANLLTETLRQSSDPDSHTQSPSSIGRQDSSPQTGTPALNSNAPSPQRQQSEGSKLTFTPEAALGTSKGVGKIVGAGMKSPMDFTLALSRGFHNVSRFYGEEPRQVDKVTGLGSGVSVAAKEFGLGMMGGISGLVRDPIKGAQKEGAAGFVKGFGKGLAGSFLKPSAAIFAIPGYTFKGIYKELSKGFGPNIENYIIAARAAQGYADLANSSPEERTDILTRWHCIAPNVKRKKNPGQKQVDSLQALLEKQKEKRRQAYVPTSNPNAAGSSFFSRPSRENSNVRQQSSSSSIHPGASWPFRPSDVGSRSSLGQSNSNSPLTSPVPQQAGGHTAHPVVPELASEDVSEEAQLEQAIRSSVAETSRGNEDEDAVIERAIRASIQELERMPPTHKVGEDDDEMIKRAIAASLAEATASGLTEDETKQLEEALRKSLTETTARSRRHRERRLRSSDSEWESSSQSSIEDAQAARLREEEETRRAIEESMRHQHSREGDDSEEARKREESEMLEVLQHSKMEADRQAEESEKARQEEAIVMEYIKKQSLEEAELQKKARLGLADSTEAGASSSMDGAGAL